MPTLMIWGGHRFRFYSSDGAEPPHVHIVKDGKSAKVWLNRLEVAYRHGYTDQQMRALLAVIDKNRDAWIASWNDFFGL